MQGVMLLVVLFPQMNVILVLVILLLVRWDGILVLCLMVEEAIDLSHVAISYSLFVAQKVTSFLFVTSKSCSSPPPPGGGKIIT